LVFRADHGTDHLQKFHRAIAAGQGATSNGKPMLNHEFMEMPSLTVTEVYLSSGQYLWSGGIFVFVMACQHGSCN
jgi:mannose-1-phosphate guanylyltransferase